MLVMDSSNQKKINSLYDNVGYFDSYSGSVIGFLVITFCIFLIWSYYAILQTKDAIKADWLNQRCNPSVIPFAGWINKPDDDSKTAFEFTNENFQFCTQSILSNMMATMMAPFTALLGQLTTVFTSLNDSSNQSRSALSSLRENVANIAKNIMNRILGVVIPLQKMLLAFTDSLAKTQAVLTSGLYTMLGSYYTLQSLMGAILEMIIKMLISLAIVIVGLWIVPVTWPAAAASTAVFASISVPLSIIALFMTKVLHIHSSGIPKIPSCFDEGSLIQMKDGSFKPICFIKTGDVLFRGETVTATMKLICGKTDMYYIPSAHEIKHGFQNKADGVVVSGCHPIQIKKSSNWFFKNPYVWCLVKDHPDAIFLPNYCNKYIYCINTSNKLIHISGQVFSDWDELFDDKLTRVLNIPVCTLDSTFANQTIETPERIYEYCEKGLNPRTYVPIICHDVHNDKSMSKIVYKKLSSVNLGETSWGGGVVYGLVDVLNHKDLHKPLKHLLTTHGTFKVIQNNSTLHTEHDYNFNIDSLLYID